MCEAQRHAVRSAMPLLRIGQALPAGEIGIDQLMQALSPEGGLVAGMHHLDGEFLQPAQRRLIGARVGMPGIVDQHARHRSRRR